MPSEDFFQLGVKAIIRNDNGHILVMQDNLDRWRKRDGITEHWGLPGGRVHKGHTPLETLTREIHEETGLEGVTSCEFFFASVWNWRLHLADRSDVGLVLFYYLCSVPPASHIVLSDEHIGYEWVGAHEAASRLAQSFPPDFLEKLKKF